VVIWCLHGFLGTGSDWEAFTPAFRAATGEEVAAPDLFAGPIADSLAEAARRFIEDEGNAVIGYSMGGRLALHALAERPEAFRAGVIISAGLGVADESERRHRRDLDEQWAGRFETEPWEKVLEAWNAQPLLAGSAPPAPRQESPRLRREALAKALRSWSPATHPELAARLKHVSTPVLWIAGERDRKYMDEGVRAVSILPHAKLWTVPEAGHRSPWEQPELVREAVSHFLGRAFSR
jgi:2-succinyl-6-hydroxy-2,4-cyclohexadiene-1-carboxylate synthase